MLLKTLKTNFIQSLSKQYVKEEAESFFYILLEYFLKMKRIDFSLNPNRLISDTEQTHFNITIFRLLKNEPIQYIIGETEFYGLRFFVNKYTLIPRPETEELVNWIVKDFERSPAEKVILDIGTGSGCIAVTLAKMLNNAKVTALDVSANALKVAESNAVINKVSLQYIEGSIFNTIKNLPNNLDIIVSNPPYVKSQEKKKMQRNVLDYEPHLALFVTNDDPLIFYKTISEFAKNNLKYGGALYVEINEYLANETIKLLKTQGFSNIELKQDIFGKDRMIKAVKLLN